MFVTIKSTRDAILHMFKQLKLCHKQINVGQCFRH